MSRKDSTRRAQNECSRISNEQAACIFHKINIFRLSVTIGCAGLIDTCDAAIAYEIHEIGYAKENMALIMGVDK